MPRLRTLEPGFPFERRLALGATPVVLANVVTPDRADRQDCLRACANDAGFMKRKPGCISEQRQCAISDSPNRFELRGVGGDRCFPGGIHQAGVQRNPLLISLVRSGFPHLSQEVAVPDVCVDYRHG